MPSSAEGSPYMPIPHGLHDGRNCSSGTLRPEEQSQTAFSNRIPVSTQSESGRMLKKPAGSIIALVFEMFLCLVALCFIALAIIALSMRNRRTGDSLGSAMEQAMKLGPTIYPILFAALLSRSLKSVGRYFAQRSVRMSTLWALMNTNATADPILHLINMPTSFLVWGLLLLWVMSPLGGQSTVRLLYKTNLTEITNPELRYWDNGPLGSMFTYTAIMVGNDGSWPLSMRDLYLASLMQGAATKAGPLDQWGNIKIPRLEAANQSEADADGWMPVGKTSGIEDFTSLFGVPVINLAETAKQGDVNFTLESTYVTLSCEPFKSVTNDNYDDGFAVSCENCFTSVGKENFIRSQKFLGLPADGFYPSGKDWEYASLQNGTIDPNNPNFTLPRTLRFNATYLLETSVTTCQIKQRFVEAFIGCVDRSCAATKLRPSITDHRSENSTAMDYWAWKVLEMISAASRSWSSRDVIWGSTTSALFLNDSSLAPIQTGIGVIPDEVNISTVSLDLFATRASILLNTGIQAFMAPTGFSGDLPTQNLSLYGHPHIPADGLLTVANQSSWDSYDSNCYMYPYGLGTLVNSGAPFVGASTNATLTHYTLVYRPDYAWTAVLIISSVFLFAVGVSGICVRLKTIAPNIFDPVMGLTYGNPYILSKEKTFNPLDADGRVNLLRDKTVQLGHIGDDKSAKAVFGEARYVEPLRLGVPYY
ncbi:hypothetical protein P175DRAFT_0557774 [Aspergillus ochraceoroseus IBT 24754]|uniref:Uncharacterized protein n=3 Tax=Aspergillus subgen. Nidulantes TaxID=2720870 RepID=A0A0F8V3T2_9EURO|nr:uncharacterized protein P175DRAFT_0557774 [Aspergillus ochraceoroseus IBT 24754]KKK12854.1 hypothetical protein AOCH_004046 [Aspergillus ochraceoroseus]KKK26428.1 hypothetical protein ARAM_005423 [Aspergillus rambellii]PTU21097.1 hypothetical protein P175DRAFT_0557774 [Aspergillus ochraceoroseus IBT 24754]